MRFNEAGKCMMSLAIGAQGERHGKQDEGFRDYCFDQPHSTFRAHIFVEGLHCADHLEHASGRFGLTPSPFNEHLTLFNAFNETWHSFSGFLLA